ncbi:MAG: nucleoside triphosphate pyrophosphohydrolase [Alistipes sp.]|jgi:XTP/dITP diphosphohydrolase|nr:nucleoside triphosphate pyrophosphohydrolase [Alistipes sp.]
MDKLTTDALSRLVDIMDRLRVECPWDREQTIESLRKNTIEETYELADAIDEGDMGHIREELGDLLLHIVFYSKIGSEQGAFTLADVAEGISDKLVYRHPHVFADVHAETPEEVKHNWEALKLREGRKKRRGVLAGVPKGLPAMVKAFRIGEKAAAVGFDWERREDVWDKVREEAAELEVEIRAADHEKATDELGDLLFALVNAARLYGIDPEAALERTNRKFISRFEHMEQHASENSFDLSSKTPAELDNLWRAAKSTETKQ